jgi:uncharacterized protein YjbI with pentapeptide repeats
MTGVNFSGSNLRGVSFYHAQPRHIDLFTLVDLQDADFTYADLRGADFWGTDLRGANFEGAKIGLSLLQKLNPRIRGYGPFEGAIYDESTKWPEGFSVSKSEELDLMGIGIVRMVSYEE